MQSRPCNLNTVLQSLGGKSTVSWPLASIWIGKRAVLREGNSELWISHGHCGQLDFSLLCSWFPCMMRSAEFNDSDVWVASRCWKGLARDIV
jgi:hypothetical protein